MSQQSAQDDPEAALAAVADEIAALHIEFERWFDGTSESLERVEQALADDFVLISPSGSVAAGAQVLAGLHAARGSRPIAIWIERAKVIWQRADLIGAIYEEWQTNDGQTTARQSSVVLQRDDTAPGGLKWLSVHETWLMPPAS